MSSQQKSCLSSLAIVIIVMLCLGGMLGYGLLVAVPARVQDSFGAPAENLAGIPRLLTSLRLLLQANDLTQPLDPTGLAQPFSVDLGESTLSITGRLQESGLIADAQALREYLMYAGLDTTLQAGDYDLSPRMTAIEVAAELQDATPTLVDFNILPGWRHEEIAAALPTSGLSFSSERFLSAIKGFPDGSPLAELIPDGVSAEGFLHPGEYQLPRDLPLYQFIAVLLGKFNAQLTPDLLAGFERQGLDLYQAVTLASIVQREAVVADEMPMIASVFINRLAQGMRLESDPTVQYALGYHRDWGGWWKSPLSLDDLQVNSSFNTYQISGLPPAPIANPGLAALQAVAFPAQTPYLYFRAACDGSGRHTFAETFEQHLANGCP
jgi:UPF0755 protein